MQNLWHACLRRLEQELPAQQFNAWIRPLAIGPVPEDSPALVLVAPNRFVFEMVRDRFVGRIGRLASEAGGRELHVKLTLARAAEAPARPAAPAPERRLAEAHLAPDRARLNRTFT